VSPAQILQILAQLPQPRPSNQQEFASAHTTAFHDILMALEIPSHTTGLTPASVLLQGNEFFTMKLFTYLWRLYSLDTLDTRFANSKSSSTIQAEASLSKWRTPEFYIYYVIFIVVVPQMFKVSYDVSKGALRT
jgi:hypothetical protein